MFSIIRTICIIMYSTSALFCVYSGIRYITVYIRDKDDTDTRHRYSKAFLRTLILSLLIGAVIFVMDVYSYASQHPELLDD